MHRMTKVFSSESRVNPCWEGKGEECNTWKTSMLTALILTIRSMSAYETWGWEFRISFVWSGVVFYRNAPTFNVTGARGIGEVVCVPTLRCKSNSMRFSSGRLAMPDAKVDEGKSNLIIATLCLATTTLTRSSICWSRLSRFGLKSLDSRNLGSWKPLSSCFSI